MKNIILALILILCICCSGCGKTETENIPVGKLVSISAVPTSFNECSKSEITTTEGIFIVQGYASGIYGTPVVIRKAKNWFEDSQWLLIGEDSYRLYRGIQWN